MTDLDSTTEAARNALRTGKGKDPAGRPWPLGATPVRSGTQFALYAPDATRVELCLFDEAESVERQRLVLPAFSDGVWHGWFDGVCNGAIYGYRVHGPWRPEAGHRFNPAKVLLDPYAREIVGAYRGSELFLDTDARDNAAVALKARVGVDPAGLDESSHLRVPRRDTVLYEAHVRSMTKLHPGVPPTLRGTYAGLVEPAVLAHLKRLGVTTLNLLPLMQRVDEPRLLRLGLSNHWGYNTIGWFCPEPRLWSGRAGTTPTSECREMVNRLHATGFEVVLDVVFNHTAEGDLHGPTLGPRGIGNRAYYHLADGDTGQYENWSGCGNCLNLSNPRVLQLAMDAMRFWVRCIGVDGFRFDLAPILARDARGFHADAAFFKALQQDPELSRAKLIAEPWDIGLGGYRLGEFPSGWQEWNDRYRDTVRRFWLHGDVSRAKFVDAFAGSSALFAPSGRDASTGINFVTAHDGFTLRDLVSYEHRHNEANGEHNCDGHGHNHSANCGVEGETRDPQVLLRRRRLQRALLATMLLSVGTPQLLAGDEIGHTQGGNNNAYCQDNMVTWLDWHHADVDLNGFAGACIELRRRHDALRRAHWLADADVHWLSNDGGALQGQHWDSSDSRALAVHFCGPVALLLLFNASKHAVTFLLPSAPSGLAWQLALCTDPQGAPTFDAERASLEPGTVLALETP